MSDILNTPSKPFQITLNPMHHNHNIFDESSKDLEKLLPDGARLLSIDTEHQGSVISHDDIDKFEEFAIVYRHCQSDDTFTKIPWSVIVMTKKLIYQLFELYLVDISNGSHAVILHRKQGVKSDFLDYLDEGSTYRFNAVAPNPSFNAELFGFKRKD